MAQPLRNQDLKTCDDRFEKLTALIPEGSLVVRPDGCVCFSSAVAREKYNIHPGDTLDLPQPLSSGGTVQPETVCCSRGDGSQLQLRAGLRITQTDWDGEDAYLVLLKDDQNGSHDAAEALRLSEQRYRAMTEGQADLICRFRPDGSLTYANGAFCAYFGRTREEMLGKSLYALLPGDVRETTRRHIKALVGRPRLVIDERPVLAAGSELRWIQVTDHAILDQDGKVIEFQAVGRDITQRKLTEKALRESEARYRALIEDSPAIICRFTAAGALTYVNETFCEFFGWRRQELIGRSILRLIAEDRRENAHALLASLDSTMSRFTREVHVVLASGERRWTRWTTRPVAGMGSQAVEFQAVGMDISESKQAEADLRVAEQRFHDLLVNMHLIAVQLNTDGTVHFANDFFYQLTGYQPQDLNGKNWFDLLLLPAERPLVEATFRRMARTGETIPYGQSHILTKTGEQRLIAWNSTVMHDSEGNFIGVASIGEDITERTWAQKEQEIVHRISQGAASSRTVEELYGLIHQSLAEVMPVDNFFISTYDAARDEISFPYFVDQFDSTPTRKRPGRGLTEYVLRTGKPLLASPEVFDELVAKGEVESLGAPSVDWLGVPLKIGANIVGVMVVQSYTERKRFRDRELQILDFVSTQIAQTIERKRAEQALRENEEKYHALVEASSDAIFLETIQGQVLECNSAACEMFGYRKDEMLQKTVADLVPEGVAKQIPEVIAIELAHGGHHWETTNRRQDGSTFPVEISTKLVDIGGQTQSVVYVSDISRRKQREREMGAIAGVSAALRTAFTQGDILPVILQQLIDRLSVHGAFISLREDGSNTTRIVLGCGTWSGLGGMLVSGHDSLCCQVVQTGKMYLNNQAASDPLFPFPQLIDGVKAIASVPLIAQGEVFGALTVGYERPIHPEEVAILTAISDIAASAIRQARLYEQTSRQAAELEEAYTATIEGWAHALELRDSETQGHSKRVTEMTLKLAERMGLTEAEMMHIRLGALLHDIGKMGIPDSILLKPGPLSADEWVIMRKHPDFAMQMLREIEFLAPALDIPYCHHEKWDGTGYPRRLKGEQIPIYARIFSVADVMDALTSPRPYRPAWSQEEALDYIERQSGSQFDPAAVGAFLKLYH